MTMLPAYWQLLRATLTASFALPAIVVACSIPLSEARSGGALAILLGIAAAVAALGLRRTGHPLERLVEDAARAQADWIDRLSERRLPLAVAAAAGLGLFLELATIRWQASVFEFFAFYKNLGLLSCFLGLGLGYSLARRREVPLSIVAPVLGWQFLLLLGLRHGLDPVHWKSLVAMPFQETLNMGIAVARSPYQLAAIGAFVGVTFVLTTLAFVPLGQLAGRLMDRGESLAAYGWNLLGSLAGVGAMLGASALWTPPEIWFAASFALLFAFLEAERRARLGSLAAAFAALVVLAWPVSVEWHRIHSPYQLIERGPGEGGLSVIRAAGLYHQAIHDLSPRAQAADEKSARLADYYELPYAIGEPVASAAIVGAGTGNDVAAALRSGVSRVAAIEIDPAIVSIGRAYHPERPYSDPRVTVEVNDARSFFRSSHATFDRIVYGLLDSHTLLSHASSVRIDSFVYTVEGLRDARARLSDDGVLSLAFLLVSPELGRKIYRMMEEAFDGHPPICLETPWGDGVLFLQRRDGGFTLPPGLLERTGFVDRTPAFADPALVADPSTDDWPFFYMPRRVYPLSYVVVLGFLLVLSVVVVGRFAPARPDFGHLVFFFLGAGFMLVETKAVTELGLAFGNTWTVIGVAIAGVLVMGYLANLFVRRFAPRGLVVPFLLLTLTLALGVWISSSGGFAPTPLGRVATVVVLTAPLLFSGAAFSICLRASGDVSGAMAANVLGAMVGGVLEYNSMYFGFAFLYALAFVMYALALSSWLRVSRTRAAAAAVEVG